MVGRIGLMMGMEDTMDNQAGLDKRVLNYVGDYERSTNRRAPERAASLAPLFARIRAGNLLPPRRQQAVDCGFSADTLLDHGDRPTVYNYYKWVLRFPLADTPMHELAAPDLGETMTSWNVFQSEMPQPLTLNAWQVADMTMVPLQTNRVVVLENNGVAVWLHHLHPEWPLLMQGGDNFNAAYIDAVRLLEKRGVQLAYLGDLDSEGLMLAATFAELLREQTPAEVLRLQTPIHVIRWVDAYGIDDKRRTGRISLADSTMQFEADTIHSRGQYVEQEQLIAEYERIIPEWLAMQVEHV